MLHTFNSCFHYNTLLADFHSDLYFLLKIFQVFPRIFLDILSMDAGAGASLLADGLKICSQQGIGGVPAETGAAVSVQNSQIA
jgi:hypothetical protein